MICCYRSPIGRQPVTGRLDQALVGADEVRREAPADRDGEA